MWLKPVNSSNMGRIGYAIILDAARTFGRNHRSRSFSQLTSLPAGTDGAEPRYSCQATRLLDAAAPLPRWDLRQFVFDVVTRNRSIGNAVRVLSLAPLGWLLRNLPFGYRVVRFVYDRINRWLTGRESPFIIPKLPPGSLTATSRCSHPRPGELVRVKSKSEIEETLDANEKNRGLSFDPRDDPLLREGIQGSRPGL